MSLAQRALEMPSWREEAIAVQFHTRSVIYEFEDGSVLTLNLYGSSYATGVPK